MFWTLELIWYKLTSIVEKYIYGVLTLSSVRTYNAHLVFLFDVREVLWKLCNLIAHIAVYFASECFQ